jgi:hypothetical protein
MSPIMLTASPYGSEINHNENRSRCERHIDEGRENHTEKLSFKAIFPFTSIS